MKRIDLKGQRFGRLVAVEFVPIKRYRPNGGVENDGKWWCVCDCGMTTTAHASDLRLGKVKSCGCLHRETIGTNARTHGKSKERLYTIWLAMKQRCYYDGYEHRKNYSLKGITVCDEWRNNYPAFREWAFAHGYFEQSKDTPHKEILSIDRIDPQKGYSPVNCQWISCDANLRKRFDDERRDAECQR